MSRVKVPVVFHSRFAADAGYDMQLAPNIRVVAYVVDGRDAVYIVYHYAEDGYAVRDTLRTADRGKAEAWIAKALAS